MDAFSLVCSGNVGKIHGLRTDKYDRTTYKFSMATHKVVGAGQSTLWLQITVMEPLALLVAERGLDPGEKVFIQTEFCELTSIYHMGTAKAWLNCLADRVIFLENRRPAQLERGELFQNDRIIDYSLLMDLKRTG